jgi:hypothetical protein
VFSYDYTIISNDYQQLLLKVVDLTDGHDLFFGTFQNSSDNYYVNTTPGHEIQIELNTYAKSTAYVAEEYSSSSFSLDYSTASVSGPPPCLPSARTAGASPTYYSSLQFAYVDALNGDTIQSQAEVIYEDLYFDLDKSVTIEGGYDCSYSNNDGITTLNADMRISDGTLKISDFRLKE